MIQSLNLNRTWATPVLKAPAGKSALSNEQKAWLKQLGEIVSSGGGDGKGKAGPIKAAAPGVGKTSTEAIAPALVIPAIVPVMINALKIKCTCKVVNPLIVRCC